MRSLKTLLLYQLAVAIIASGLLATSALVAKYKISAEAERAMVAKDVTADILPPPMYLIEIRLALSKAVEGTISPAELQTDFDRLVRDFNSRVDYWRTNPPYGLESQLLGAQHTAAEVFIAEAQAKVVRPLLAGDKEAARQALPQIDALYMTHRKGVDATVVTAGQFATMSVGALQSTSSTAMLLLSVLTAATLIALLAFYVWLRRAVWSAVGAEPAQIAAVAAEVAQGNLAQPIETTYPASVAASLERMRVQFARVVEEVRNGVNSVSTASSQIAEGNNDLSARTEEQASSLEQTAASMEQMTSTVQQNAETAREASALASSACQVAERGGKTVHDVVATMGAISSSSKRVAEIIGVIDGIAFQTNILALNAAVEAARAGEQGRGFAVVASEVRGLAQRSAQAAREIKALIGESVEKVDSGSKLVGDAGQTMSEIVEQVRRVASLIDEIARATREQSSGLAQVNEAVASIDQTTQQNAALVEQSAAAAQSLRDQAQALATVVASFRISPAHAR